MAGLTETNRTTNKKQAFEYIILAPPNNVIDSTTFVLDFTERNFIHNEIDPTD